MKIALFYNLPAGGAKRALFEHARHLKSRGYVIDAYVPSTAAEAYLPLAPVCQHVFRYPVPPVSDAAIRRLQRPALEPLWQAIGVFKKELALNTLRVGAQRRESRILDGLYEIMARDIDARRYDIAYVHQCIVQQSPRLLRLLRTPSVYFCQDTLRYVYEWPAQEHPQFDAMGDSHFLRRTLGNFHPHTTLRHWAEKERTYIDNTRSATRVLANSWYSREAIVRTTGVNARVCYLGVDAEFFCPDPTVPRDARTVLSVGGLMPHKRHDFLIDALATVPARRRPRLEIIGYEMTFGAKGLGPYARYLIERAADAHVELCIHKDVTDGVLRDAYRRAGVFAFAPYLEPFGFVPLEAMACGTPVVGVSEGGVRETVRDGETGLLTDRDEGEFGHALDRVLCDERLGARLGTTGRDDVENRWTWERSVDTLEHHFAQALAAGAR